MKSKRIVLFFALFLFCAGISFSQDLGKVIFGAKSKVDYIGQYTDNHKKKNGLGIQRYRNGNVYIGDFSQNILSGKGMLISTKGIANAQDAVVYVGSWKFGEKHGKGICYAANGDIIYQGKFEHDVPVDTYPTINPDVDNYFTMKEVDNGLYWGEVTCGVPNGFGIMVQEDGSMAFGMFDNGVRTGVHMTIYGEEDWEVGTWENSNYTAFNNTQTVAERRKEHVAARKALNREFWGEFIGIAKGLAETGMDLATQGKGITSSLTTSGTDNDMAASTSNATSSSAQSSSSRKSNSSSTSKNDDCGTAWMSDKRSYSNYESTLIRDAGSLSESDRKSIQNKMKNIRLKWEKRGCPFTKSSYE